jgi:hypothetical protein
MMNKNTGSIEEIFDQFLAEIHAGKRNADELFVNNPEYRDEFEPLFTLSNRLSQARELKASTKFRDSTLARFKDVANTKEHLTSNPYPTTDRLDFNRKRNQSTKLSTSIKRGNTSPRWNRISFSLALSVSLIILFFILSSGVVLAANNSLPGGSFYPLKQSIERTELKLSTTEQGDQQLHLKFAVRRLIEVDRLLQLNRNLYIDLALDNYRANLSPLVARLQMTELPAEERVQLANLILRSSSIDESQLNSLYQRILPEQRALIMQAIEEARAAREIANQIVDQLPDLRTSIRTTLESSLGLSTMATTWPTAYASQGPGATGTPTPGLTNFGFPNPSVTPIGSVELPYWLTNTPDWSQLATLYPTIYPTLVSLATNFPLINGTLQPPVIPTIIFPTVQIPTYQLPTPMPIPPIPPIPTYRPPPQIPTSVPIPQIPTPPVVPIR